MVRNWQATCRCGMGSEFLPDVQTKWILLFMQLVLPLGLLSGNLQRVIGLAGLRDRRYADSGFGGGRTDIA